jgi:hypothetical protein
LFRSKGDESKCGDCDGGCHLGNCGRILCRALGPQLPSSVPT